MLDLLMSVYMQVDGAVIGTTPLVPVNGTSSTPLAHIVETGSSGARTVPPQPNRIMRRALSLTAVGRSVFSYTFLAPSTPGAHTIMAVVTSGGTTTPIAAPVVSCTFTSRNIYCQIDMLPFSPGLALLLLQPMYGKICLMHRRLAPEWVPAVMRQSVIMRQL